MAEQTNVPAENQSFYVRIDGEYVKYEIPEDELHRVDKWSLLAYNVESQTVQELQFIEVVALSYEEWVSMRESEGGFDAGLIGRRGIPIGRILRAHFNDAGSTTW